MRRSASKATPPKTAAPPPPDGWGPSSLAIAEKLWGEGFIEPGSTQLARRIIAPANPDSMKTVLDLTTGLGGNAFMLARESSVWMEAYEPNLVLAEKAREIAQSYMLGKRVPIRYADSGILSLTGKRYDLIYSRERLYTTAHKHGLIQQYAGTLKPGGLLLITDYVRHDQADFTPAFNSWANAEPDIIFPWTASQIQGRNPQGRPQAPHMARFLRTHCRTYPYRLASYGAVTGQ